MIPATVDRCTNSVKLTPISSLEGLCPGKSIIFICQINSNTSSTILAWHSEEYIDELPTFMVFNTPGMMMMDPMFMDTVATYNATGTSLLVLKPRADAPNAIITCINENTACSNSTTFRLLGMYMYTILLMHATNNIITSYPRSA